MAVRCSPATTSSARQGLLNDRSAAHGTARGVWRWHEILPVRDWSNVVTLGEGSTPLLEAPRLGDAYGIGRLLVKAESLNPTGSFKARGMTVAVSRAKELGATSFVMPSAGNAGGALAAYAARRGYARDGRDAERRTRREPGRGRGVRRRAMMLWHSA